MLDLKGIGFSTFDNHIAMDKDVLLRECGRLYLIGNAIVEFIVLLKLKVGEEIGE